MSAATWQYTDRVRGHRGRVFRDCGVRIVRGRAADRYRGRDTSGFGHRVASGCGPETLDPTLRGGSFGDGTERETVLRAGAKADWFRGNSCRFGLLRKDMSQRYLYEGVFILLCS